MSYRGSIFTYSVEFETANMTVTHALYFNPGKSDAYTQDWDKSNTYEDIPTTLGTAFDHDSIGSAWDEHDEDIQYHSQFAAPQDCRLQAIAWAFDHQTLDTNTTGVEIGIVKFGFGVGSTATDTGSWTLIGYADTTTVHDMDGSSTAQVHSGVSHSDSSESDLLGGQPCGIFLQVKGPGAGDGCGITNGIITLTFRAL